MVNTRAASRRRDWAGLPEAVLAQVAGCLARSADAAFERRPVSPLAILDPRGFDRHIAPVAALHDAVDDPTPEQIQLTLLNGGNLNVEGAAPATGAGADGLLAFAGVCKPWRRAAQGVGRLRTRVRTVLQQGDLSLVRWALGQGMPTQRPRGAETDVVTADHACNIQEMAASVGELDCLQWLHDSHESGKHPDLDGTRYNYFAARGGSLRTFQWLATKRLLLRENTRTCIEAAANGNLELVKWLCTKHFRWSEDVCTSAAGRGHLALLQWLRAEGCAWDAQTCSRAAFGGHLEVLIWARQNGCEWTAGTVAKAALGGALECLQWARANGAPWCAKACSHAVEGGSLEILQWLRANSCPWDAKTCHAAAEAGRLDVLRWAREQQPPCSWTKWTMAVAAWRGHFDVVKFCHENGCEWDESTFNGAAAGANGSLEIVSYLHEVCARPAPSLPPGPPAPQTTDSSRTGRTTPPTAQWPWRTRRRRATCSSSSGFGPGAIRGTRKPSWRPRGRGTWPCCAGPGRTGATGTHAPCRRLPRWAAWRS